MPPLTTELDARAFRDALTLVAETTGMAVVICDDHGKVVFATARARRLLADRSVPAPLIEIAAGADEPVKVTLPGTTNTVKARAQRLPGTARYLLITLAEEASRSALSKSLITRFGLSAREVQLVQLTSRGLTNREIAERLSLSEATVKTYMHGLFREVGVRNRAELVALAERMAV